jgi:hypothetical protein
MVAITEEDKSKVLEFVKKNYTSTYDLPLISQETGVTNAYAVLIILARENKVKISTGSCTEVEYFSPAEETHN